MRKKWNKNVKENFQINHRKGQDETTRANARGF